MKFLILDTYYPDFLKDYYRDHDNPNHIFKQLFASADFFSRNLKRLGHEAQEVIINDERFQKLWSSRQGYRIGSPLDTLIKHLPYFRGVIRPSWLFEAIKLQIKVYKPDILYFQDTTYLPPEFVFDLKGDVKFVIGQIASRLPPDEYFRPFDLIVSSLPNVVDHLRSIGQSAEYLPLAFESTILPLFRRSSKRYDAVHIGGYGPIHQQRNKVLETAARKVKIDFWGYGAENLKPDSPIRKNFHGTIWGKEMYQLLYNSKLTMTKHISSVASVFANNQTLFEATGCGTLLITDYKKNLPDLFVPEKEVVTYRSASELTEKINFYLKHDTQRKKIAISGQRRTIKNHNYLIRMKQLLKIIKSYL